MTSDDDCWRRISCSSRIARSTPGAGGLGVAGDRLGEARASMSKLIGSGPTFVISCASPWKMVGRAVSARAVVPDGDQHAQRADLAVGVDLLAIERGRVHRGFGSSGRFGHGGQGGGVEGMRIACGRRGRSQAVNGPPGRRGPPQPRE